MLLTYCLFGHQSMPKACTSLLTKDAPKLYIESCAFDGRSATLRRLLLECTIDNRDNQITVVSMWYALPLHVHSFPLPALELIDESYSHFESKFDV